MRQLLLLFIFVSSGAFAACEQSIDLDIHCVANQVELTWNPHWTQTAWRVELSHQADFTDFESLGTTSLPFFHWISDATSGSERFFRVIAVEAALEGEVLLIEDFEWPSDLHSFQDEDLDPSAWNWARDHAMDGEQSLRLSGYSAKALYIGGSELEMNSTYRVAAYSESPSDRQMIGFADSLNTLWYVLWGEEGGYPDSPGQTAQAEISSYQGWFPTEEWTSFLLPIGQDWMSKFGYTPTLCEVVFTNRTASHAGCVRFDSLEDVTGLSAARPACMPTWQNNGLVGDSLEVQLVDMGNAESCTRRWFTGDGRVIQGAQATLRLLASRDHRLVLEVRSEDDLISYADLLVPASVGGDSRNMRLGFTGDVMTARNYIGINSLIDLYGADTLFSNVRERFQSMDLMSVNLETPYTTVNDPHPTKGIIFRANPEDLSLLVNAGVDYAALANNHVFDHLQDGMNETMQHLSDRAIACSGAGSSSWIARQPAFMSAQGLSVGTISMSDRTGHYNNAQPYLDAGPSRPGFAPWNRGEMQATIPALSETVDLTIVQVHSGYEYSQAPVMNQGVEPSAEGDRWLLEEGVDPISHGLLSRELLPNQSERSLRQEAIDLGANLVITHHPHILQGLELYEGALIAHSLGNFLMDLSYVETKITGLLEVEMGDAGLSEVLFHPAFLNRYIPRFATGDLAAQICDYVAELSRPYGTWLLRPTASNEGLVVLDTLNANLNSTFETLVINLGNQDGTWISAPTPLGLDGVLASVRAQSENSGVEVRLGRNLVWWGGMEDEGAYVWEINSANEGHSTAEAHVGSQSLWQEASAGGSTSTYYTGRAPVVPTRAHSLLGYMKTSAEATARLQMRWYSSRYGDVIETQDLPEVSQNPAWTQRWANLDMPSEGDFYQLRCRTLGLGTTGEAYFDDVELIEWDEWQPLETSLPLELPFPSDLRFVQIRRASALPSLSLEVERRTLLAE
jgi:hypothetical protein